jgi:hypothetical protein
LNKSSSDESLLYRLNRKVQTTLLGQASWIDRHGTFREREACDLISRPHYTYGILRAADTALYFGHNKVTVCEFGVASGGGLLAMIEIAELVTQETGVEIRIVGFDTGAGLPDVSGHKDHAEMWMPGDFEMEEQDKLVARIGGRAALIFGDIKDTIEPFVASLTPDAPVGFVSIDVDIYSGTVSALQLFDGDVNLYTPTVSMYFDDLSFFSANDWCGEALAIREFNETHELRKIGPDRSLPGRRTARHGHFHRHMYGCHLLDHDARNLPKKRDALTIGAHHEFMSKNNLY